MALDIIARGLAAAEIARQKRLRILNTLCAAMARTGLLPLERATVLPVIGPPAATTTIPTGTTWQVSDGSGALHAGKYTFTGANWGNPGTTYPNTVLYRGKTHHNGNGTDPTANPAYGGRVRFALDAPGFEIQVQCAGTGTGSGFRLKVDGEYAKAGTLGVEANGALRFIPITWGDGSAAFRKTRHYELEFYSAGAFGGVRTTNQHRPSPWPQPDGLRVLLHGDSMLATMAETGDRDAALLPANGYLLGDLLGQSDTWVSGTGGAGWFAPVAHTQNWFNDRVGIDVIAHAPDVIIELGGGNDAGMGISQASQQAAVQSWLDAVIAARPDTIVFMTGPLASGAPAQGHQTVMAAKAAAAKAWPRNVAFIDNLTDAWFFGTGRQGAPTGDGNRDWAVGPDGSHPTIEGHSYLAQRIGRGIARAIPGLVAAQG